MLDVLKRWWWVFVAVLAAVGTFLLTLLRPRPAVLQQENPEKKAAEEDAQKKVDEAHEEHDKTQTEAQQAHDNAEKALVDSQKQLAKELESDPDALNEYLKKTGKDVRGP